MEGIYPNRGFFTNNTKSSTSFVGVCHLDCDSRQEFVKENLLRNLKKVDISQQGQILCSPNCDIASKSTTLIKASINSSDIDNNDTTFAPKQPKLVSVTYIPKNDDCVRESDSYVFDNFCSIHKSCYICASHQFCRWNSTDMRCEKQLPPEFDGTISGSLKSMMYDNLN